MKNTLSVEVCLDEVPLKPFEWDRMSFIMGLKLKRVKSEIISDILLHDCIIDSKERVLLLSDTKSSLLVKLDESGVTKMRSFLTFKKDEEICELACSMKISTLDYRVLEKKIEYSLNLKEELKMKEFIIKSIKSIKDEDKSKYLYYLYFDDVKNYSKERLLDSIKEDKSGNCEKLYDFLISN